MHRESAQKNKSGVDRMGEGLAWIRLGVVERKGVSIGGVKKNR